MSTDRDGGGDGPAKRAPTQSETVHDKPQRAQTAPTVADKPARTASVEPPVARVVTTKPAPPASAPIVRASSPPTHPGSSLSLTTASDAMRDEEITRTRMFIRVGALLSISAIGTVPFLHAPQWMNIVFISALIWGLSMGQYYHHMFGDPRRYDEKQLLRLAVFSIINAHVGILYYGVFTIAPVIIVIGLHFAARTEAARAARALLWWCVGCYALCAGLIVSGIIRDPAVFATDRELPRYVLALGAAFVLAMYGLAYYTSRALRLESLSSIEGLQRATRLASQRKALMDELRADLERALRVGGPGRHTDQTVGPYKLGNVLGRGAMGEVYEAIDTATNEPVAVKLLRRELLADPTQVARFLREAKASGSLASPHVVRILDAAAGDEGVPFLAMERLQGQTLAEVLRREGRLAADATLDLVRQVGAGVDAATAEGIVHRDLKPQNLFRDERGGGALWKILDFGVATLAGDSGTLTAGGIVGTPNYMAAEQAKGQRVDSRADIYAVAAVAYRCLTGRHPFTAPDTPALLYAVVHRMPTRPTDLAELPADIDRWVAIALAKSPDDRFSTGAEVATTLAAALAGELDPKLRKRADALIRKHGWEGVT